MTAAECGIYAILCEPSGKVYVGQSGDIKGRWRAHRRALRLGLHGNSHLQAAWNKYGVDAFTFQVLELCLAEELVAREQFHVDEFRGAGKELFNQGACAANPNRGRKMSAESVAKRSAAVRGRPSPKRGIPQSPDGVEKMRRALLGRVITPEHRAKLSAALKGRRRSPEQRRRISESTKGRAAHNKGQSHTPEARRKISAAMKGRPAHNRRAVMCLTTGEIFPSITAAAKAKKVDVSSLAKAIKADRRILGLVWAIQTGERGNE